MENKKIFFVLPYNDHWALFFLIKNGKICLREFSDRKRTHNFLFRYIFMMGNKRAIFIYSMRTFLLQAIVFLFHFLFLLLVFFFFFFCLVTFLLPTCVVLLFAKAVKYLLFIYCFFHLQKNEFKFRGIAESIFLR